MARINGNDTTTTVVPTILVLCNDNNRPSKTKEQWSVCELKALTEFLQFHTLGESWPSHKQDTFGDVPVEFVKLKGGAVRSGKCLDCLVV